MKIIFNILEVLIVLVPILMTVAFVTIAERKVMASMQRRCGPNAVGIWGILQPLKVSGIKIKLYAGINVLMYYNRIFISAEKIKKKIFFLIFFQRPNVLRYKEIVYDDMV
jgi:NADH:ubiquinone oxidoreductase subunit H